MVLVDAVDVWKPIFIVGSLLSVKYTVPLTNDLLFIVCVAFIVANEKDSKVSDISLTDLEKKSKIKF